MKKRAMRNKTMFNTLDCTERFLCAWQVLLFMGIPWNSLSARARAGDEGDSDKKDSG